MTAPNICRSAVFNLLHVVLLPPEILRLFLHFFENSRTLALGHDNPLLHHQHCISVMYQDLCSLMCIKICSCTANVITLATLSEC